MSGWTGCLAEVRKETEVCKWSPGDVVLVVSIGHIKGIVVVVVSLVLHGMFLYMLSNQVEISCQNIFTFHFRCQGLVHFGNINFQDSWNG
jgi:hypothetical protein